MSSISSLSAITNSLKMRMQKLPSYNEFEESFVGKPAYHLEPYKDKAVSSILVAVSITMGLMYASNEVNVIPRVFDASSLDIFLVSIIFTAVTALALWVTLTVIVKGSIYKDTRNAFLGLGTAWILFAVLRYLANFVLIEADWEVIWANRVLVLIGQQMTEQMTQSPGSPQCLDLANCYGINQNFRLWWILYLTFIVIGAAYGTSGDKPTKFLLPFSLMSVILMFIAWNGTAINYHRMVPVTRIGIATVLTYLTYGLSYYYCSISEEYKANRLRTYVGMGAVGTFFFALLIMDPPQFVKDIAELLGGVPAQSMSEEIISGSHVPSVLDKLAGDGIEASQWGGLFVNLIVASAGCVLGFGIGVVLAFGRQSDQPFFKVPSVALIEIVRSGPLICWLYFAVFMMPDLMDPFYKAEDIIRMLLMFGFFGGCYIAEVLRGGLQAVDSGQKEAAIALGLTPFQTKLTVELPNAVRTTLPSIVSVFIGLWKDTTLLFIVNILDFFKLSKDLPNTDLRFLGSFLEPVWVSALVFWIFAFYMSRVSMRIEKSLGLVKEGGGELA